MKHHRASAFLTAFLIPGILFLSCKSTVKDDHYKVVSVVEPDSLMQVRLAGIKAMDIFMNLEYPFSFTGKNEQRLWCRLIKPPTIADCDPAMSGLAVKAVDSAHPQKFPLIVVLHGSGASGTDNISQMGVLVKMWAINSIRCRYPAYILAPQFPQRSSDYVTDQTRGVLTSRPQPALDALLELIDSLKMQKDIDSNRIYVMGFSMGGSTALNAISRRPDLFAAGISFSGIPDFDGEDKFLKVPLWIIHGNADVENPFASDSLLYKELSAKGASKLLFWEMDKMGHELPKQLYADTLLPAWLFSKRK